MGVVCVILCLAVLVLVTDRQVEGQTGGHRATASALRR